MPADSQKHGKAMSNGRRIDDHSFWAGNREHDSVFPDGPHKVKNESSAESSGNVMHYQDTTEAIRAAQVEGTKKVKGHQGKLPQYRN